MHLHHDVLNLLGLLECNPILSQGRSVMPACLLLGTVSEMPFPILSLYQNVPCPSSSGSNVSSKSGGPS